MQIARVWFLVLLAATLGPRPVDGQQAAGAGPADGLELRVMSFNIRYGAAADGENHWHKRRELVFGVFADHRPDVAGLQEALAWQLDEIRAAHPQYSVMGVGRIDGKRQGEFAAILYLTDRFEVARQGTFWLSDTPRVPGSRSWGNTLPRTCTWARLIEKESGRGFYVYNLHLDHLSQPSRERSAVLLAQRISRRRHHDPVMVTGDFNAGEGNPAIRFLTGDFSPAWSPSRSKATSPSLVDTFRVLHPEAVEVGTFHAFSGRTDGEKIDYVFVQPEARVLEAAIIHDHRNGRYPSDHFPVFARVLLVVR